MRADGSKIAQVSLHTSLSDSLPPFFLAPLAALLPAISPPIPVFIRQSGPRSSLSYSYYYSNYGTCRRTSIGIAFEEISGR